MGPLRPPQNVRPTYTKKSGEITLRLKRVRGVRAGYTVQAADDVSGSYGFVCSSSSSRILIPGLIPTKIYWFRVCANGAAGPSGWSNPIKVIAI